MTWRAALITIVVLLALAWAYYHGGRQIGCPRPVLVAGTTVSCDGRPPSPDPTRRA